MAAIEDGGAMSVGWGQLVLILLIVLVLFGAGRVPRAMADLAKGLRLFKKEVEREDEETSILPASEKPSEPEKHS